jgi:hypothetical protein
MAVTKNEVIKLLKGGTCQNCRHKYEIYCLERADRIGGQWELATNYGCESYEKDYFNGNH